jgi:PAS domain S-box-containing protein
LKSTPRAAGGATTRQQVRRWTSRVERLSRPARYAIAVAAAAGGLVLRLAFDPVWEGQLPFITLFPAIMVSAWVGGFGPGLLTTLLAGLGAAYFWVPPLRSLLIVDPAEWLGMSAFFVIGVFISALNEAWRRGTVALADSEQRLAVTLASIGDAVLTTDESGVVRSMNEVAERLTGWGAAEATDRPVEDVVALAPEHAASDVPSPVRRALRDGKVVSVDAHTLVSREGGRIPIDVSAAPIRLADRAGGVVVVFRDISERRRLDQERESRARIARELAAIVETSEDAIISKDLRSTVRSWNHGAEQIFGYTAAEMIGRSIRTIIPDERWNEEDDVVRELGRGNRVNQFETIRRRKDGTDVHVSLTISPIYSPDGLVVGASTIARDITERRQAEAERARLLAREQEARAQIERAGRLKDDFLAVLSHELRTPLNAVLGYAHLLVSGAVPPEGTRRALDAIQRNAQAQARLVESLLDLSRVLAGKLELNADVTELSAVITLAVDAVSPEALKRNISLEVSGAKSVRVFADGARLQQVFWNLLSNAIKFTPDRGQVTVDLASTDTEAVVRVRDNGRGIAGSLLPYVFDRFKQGEGEGSRSRTGLGLGLAIVREMVHAHRGTVTAESAGEGRGATFTVRLPLLLAPETGAPATTQTNRHQHPALHHLQPSILIVDDERDARDMLGLMLQARGARVQHVGTAAEAFASMVDRRPDVLLADIGMPGEDGYSLIRRWRTHERTVEARVTAIAVTAYASLTDRELALAAGFDWHIAKPVDGDELIRVIAALQNTRQRPVGD